MVLAYQYCCLEFEYRHLAFCPISWIMFIPLLRFQVTMYQIVEMAGLYLLSLIWFDCISDPHTNLKNLAQNCCMQNLNRVLYCNAFGSI